MKTYLAVYMGTPETMAKSGWFDLAPDERKAREEKGIASWRAWMSDNADALAFEGGPLGKTKQTSKTGIDDVTNSMTGFVVLRAASHEDAAKKFLNHPHFSVFPGEAVEIMEMLPIPGQ
ncbi:MAG: hypothetical protein R3C42_06490 [Parvularculaceae bacterium]|nr:hypothetical protein [Parvularculaceae bacterium]